MARTSQRAPPPAKAAILVPSTPSERGDNTSSSEEAETFEATPTKSHYPPSRKPRPRATSSALPSIPSSKRGHAGPSRATTGSSATKRSAGVASNALAGTSKHNKNLKGPRRVAAVGDSQIKISQFFNKSAPAANRPSPASSGARTSSGKPSFKNSSAGAPGNPIVMDEESEQPGDLPKPTTLGRPRRTSYTPVPLTVVNKRLHSASVSPRTRGGQLTRQQQMSSQFQKSALNTGPPLQRTLSNSSNISFPSTSQSRTSFPSTSQGKRRNPQRSQSHTPKKGRRRDEYSYVEPEPAPPEPLVEATPTPRAVHLRLGSGSPPTPMRFPESPLDRAQSLSYTSSQKESCPRSLVFETRFPADDSEDETANTVSLMPGGDSDSETPDTVPLSRPPSTNRLLVSSLRAAGAPQPHAGDGKGSSPSSRRRPASPAIAPVSAIKKFKHLAPMDDESYRPSPKTKVAREVERDKARNKTRGLSKNRPRRFTDEPGRYTLPDPSTPIEQWPVAKGYGSTSRIKPRRAVVAIAPSPETVRNQREDSTQLSPPPSQTQRLPFERQESSPLSPAPSQTLRPIPAPGSPVNDNAEDISFSRSPSRSSTPFHTPPSESLDLLQQFAAYNHTPIAASQSSVHPRTPSRATPSKASQSARSPLPLSQRLSLSPVKSMKPMTSQNSAHLQALERIQLAQDEREQARRLEEEREHAKEEKRRAEEAAAAAARFDEAMADDDDDDDVDLLALVTRSRRQSDEEADAIDDIENARRLAEVQAEADDFDIQEEIERERKNAIRLAARQARTSGGYNFSADLGLTAIESPEQRAQREKVGRQVSAAHRRFFNNSNLHAVVTAADQLLEDDVILADEGTPMSVRPIGDLGSDEVGELVVENNATVEAERVRLQKATEREMLLHNVFWKVEEGEPAAAQTLPKLGMTNDPVVSLLRAATDSTELVSLLSCGIALEVAQESRAAISEWLMKLAFGAEHNELAWLACEQLVSAFRAGQGNTGLVFELLIDIWRQLGARMDLSEGVYAGNVEGRLHVVRDRETASYMICQIVIAWAQPGVAEFFDASEGGQLLSYLLALAADVTTSPALARLITEAASTVITYHDASDQLLAVLQIAASCLAKLPRRVQARAVQSLGQGSALIRCAARLVAVEVLQPGSMKTISEHAVVGTSQSLVTVLDEMSASLRHSNADLFDLSYQFSLWTSAVTDIGEVTRQLSAKETAIITEQLGRLRNILPDHVPDDENPVYANNLKSRANALWRVVPLHEVMARYTVEALERRKHRMINGGQTRLSFAGSPRK